MKPVLVKLNEINKYVLENYKQQGTNKIEVLENILELLDDTKLEIKYLAQAIEDNRLDVDSPVVDRAFTRESLLKNILKVINNLEAENNGV